MKMDDYMKKSAERLEFKAFVDDVAASGFKYKFSSFKKTTFFGLLALGVVLFSLCAFFQIGQRTITISSEDGVKLAYSQLASTSVNRSLITIPSGTVKANPFLPYKDVDIVVETDLPDYTLVEPPEMLSVDSEAVRVMNTAVSGILYDKFSPSAILNVEGTDYLVKKGDVVNNYEVVNIMQNAVTVRLGANIYTAGIGEILTGGKVHHNNIPNLDKKFGGVK